MLRLLAVLWLSLSTPACFVFEELDKGAAIMDAHSPKNLDDDPPTREVPTEEPSRLAAWTDSVKSWWGEMREPEQPTRDPSDVPVACRLRGTTRFMHRSECLVQGGEPR